MRNKIFLLSVVILLCLALTACGGAKDSGDPAYEALTVVIKGLPGGDVEISIAELRKLPQYDLEASYLRTTGTYESFQMRGPYLRDVIALAGGNIDDYAGVGVSATDAYYCLVSKEIVEITPDLMLALFVDGKYKLDEGVAPAWLAVQGQFGPYWVKMVNKITLYSEIPEKEITSVWVFNSLAESIEPYMYEYYGSKDKSYELKQIFTRLGTVNNNAFFTIKSSDGFQKTEAINMLLSEYYIKVEGADAPTNMSPHLQMGMNVRSIGWVSTNADAMVFPEQLMLYMENVTINGKTGVRLDDLLYETGVSEIRGKFFRVYGTDGEYITVSGDDLKKGILVPGLDNTGRVVWDESTGYENIDDLLRIRLVPPPPPPPEVCGICGEDPCVCPSPPEVCEICGQDPCICPPVRPNLPGSLEPTADTVLIITGNGVAYDLYLSLADLKSLTDGYREAVYSTMNNFPTKGNAVAKGIDLAWLLDLAGVLPEAKTVKVQAGDGYSMNFTKEQLLQTRYSYPGLASGSAQGAFAVPTLIAWAFRQGTTNLAQADEDDLRLVIGQDGLNGANTPAMVQMTAKITVTLDDPGRWDGPSFSLQGGLLTVSHPSLNNVKIYYTTDGTAPTVNSAVYNPSTTSFQPDLIKPIPVAGVTVVKVLVVGFGKYESEVVVYEVPAH